MAGVHDDERAGGEEDRVLTQPVRRMGYPRARGLQRVLTKEVEDHMHGEVSLIAEHARA